ncbi:MAG: inositol-3-phosphate synthase [Elusimicrobia bacterium]|nr:inositol-3-phosphate synthase [Elusimicrobiota bacterium]
MSKEKTGVLMIGLNGATANTTVVGTKVLLKKLVPDYGMITQSPLFAGHPLIKLDQLVFGGWDLHSHNAYDAAVRNKVLEENWIKAVRKDIEKIRPMKGIVTSHDVDFLKSLDNIKPVKTRKAQLEAIIKDIRSFKKANGLKKTVVVFLASPLKCVKPGRIHKDIKNLKRAIATNDPAVTSGMLYALAAIETDSPYIDFTPNITLELPALADYAAEKKVPLAGQDGNTGQTMMKTLIGQMLKIKNLRLAGWYSTNILGNMDGKVLALPEHCVLKMKDKLDVLSAVLGYGGFDNIVDIRYYLPRGDNKEAWDNIDFLGWLGMPMSCKINWLGRDSILAAPLVLDLIRLLEYAHRRGEGGVQGQLAMFFKHPLGAHVRGFFDEYTLLREHYSKPDEAYG